MSMVSSKLGIGAVERGVAVGFWLLDPGKDINVSFVPLQEGFHRRRLSESPVSCGKEGQAHPFLWAFLL